MLSRIRVSYKLLLIYALDMVAVVFFGFSLAEEKYISINFARKELAGSAYISAARDTLFAVADYEAAGRDDADKAMVLQERLLAVAKAENLYGTEMSSAETAKLLQREGQALLDTPPDQVSHSAQYVIAATRALIARVGDQSNLILDPDLDSYYSMSLVLLRFPELVDLLFQIRVKLHQIEGQMDISADDRTEFLLLEGRLTNVIRGIEGDRVAGYRGNADGVLERALTPGFSVFDEQVGNLLAQLRVTIIDRDGQPDTLAVDRAVGESLRSSLAVWQTTSREMERLIETRIDGFFSRMWEHFGIAGALLVIILSMVLLVARRISVPISHLADVAETVRRTNDYNLRAKWDSDDEIGKLVDSFNTMLERLQVEGARREEMVAQSRAAQAQHELIEAIPTPLTVARLSDNALLHVNQPASALLGLTSECGDADYLLPTDRRSLQEQLDLNGAVNKFEAEIVSRSGAHFWALISARLLTYQGEEALLTTITPITERKQMEVELLAAKDKAEDMVAELRQAQQSLIQAEKMASLGGLVAGVAHEINTPVGIGLTGASTLAAETDKIRKLHSGEDMTEEDFLDYLDVTAQTAKLLLTNMNRAAELIQSFKQVAVDQTSAERRRFDLKNYIEEILNSLHPSIKKKRHTVEVDCPTGIEMDSYPGVLSQVLTNLVMNALLHAYADHQAGTLSIRVKMNGGDVILVFADDGNGIPAENLSRIFDPFFTTRRGNGGSGLGLHIVFNVVTASLNGQVDVQSEVGKGTRFTLRFPQVAPKIAPAPVIEAAPQPVEA